MIKKLFKIIKRIFFKEKSKVNPYDRSHIKIFNYQDEEIEKTDDAILDLSEVDNAYLHFTAKSFHAHDLKKLVKEVDEEYFEKFFGNNGILPRISWWWRGAKRNSSHAIGGLAFCCHNEILINVRFNTKKASRDIVKLLVYHEMLHLKLYAEQIPFGHTREFYSREEKFKDYSKYKKEKNDFYETNVIAKPLSELRFKKPKTVYDSTRFKTILKDFVNNQFKIGA